MAVASLPVRTADPYRDTDVIDRRAPRFLQATIGVVSLIALVTGWWGLFGLLALQLIVGLTFGRQFCLPCLFYFEVVQPRVGEGEIEDARPPRFANTVGAAFLTTATFVHAAGMSTLGWVLGGIVTVLALLAAATGFCVGCEFYRVAARARGVKPGEVRAVDLKELGVVPDDEIVVQFTHPLCTECRDLENRFTASEDRLLLTVDVSKHPDLARKYHVAVVPAAFTVDRDGTVLERLAK